MSETKIETAIDELKKSFNESSKSQKILAIFTAVMALAIIIQALILYNQVTIIESASIPNSAQIHTQVYHHSMDDISQHRDVSKIPTLERWRLCREDQEPIREPLDVIFQNKGRLDTGPINLRLYSDDFNTIPQNGQESMYVSTIASGETKVFGWAVYGNKNFCGMNKTSSEIRLVYNCIFCEEHDFEKTVKIEIKNIMN